MIVSAGVEIPGNVVQALLDNNRIKRGKLVNGDYVTLDPKNCPTDSKICSGDSESASFSLLKINTWLTGLGVGQISLNNGNTFEDFELKITFGSHFEIGDDVNGIPYAGVDRGNGQIGYPVHPDYNNDSGFDLPNANYLGQQTAILTIVRKGTTLNELRDILLPLGDGGDGSSLDVAKLCPPDCT